MGPIATTEHEAITASWSPLEHIEELPLKVVPDWDEQLRRAEAACRLIDRHLDYEGGTRMLTSVRHFRPQHLCPEQRVQLITDLYPLSGASLRG